ncbi:MAG: alpha/beta fold hydrolase [Gammaproteobacteria bacterium]|nr:alpha/beta fold hydrolase [Gammaproteobacteria bacterium]
MVNKASIQIRMLIFIWLAVSVGVSAEATNSDTAKERRWAQQVIDGLLDGDEAWLIDDSGHEFLGIFTEGDKDSGQAVVLIHGIGVHPNWPDVIYPLRAGLLEHGITTLSIQMPILANEADPREYELLYSEVPGRIDAALEYLDDEGYGNVTLVAHSMGAGMATHYLSGSNPDAVSSLVIIGMSPGLNGSENIEALERVKVPVFDLFGSEDLEQVLSSEEDRRAAATSGSHRVFRQVSVTGASHFFQGHESDLVRHVIEWLELQSD